LGVGVKIADMLAQEILIRNLRDRRIVARYARRRRSPTRATPSLHWRDFKPKR
jgi:hypothetical protein